QELRILETGDHAEDATLLARAEPRLESDHVPHLTGSILAPQLHYRPGSPACTRIPQSYRLHRPEPQCVGAALRHHLDRQASLEVRDARVNLWRRRWRIGVRVRHVLPVVSGIDVSRSHFVDDSLALFTRPRSIQVGRASTLVIE